MPQIEKILWEKFNGGSQALFDAVESLLIEATAISGLSGNSLVKELLNRYTFVSHDIYDEGIACIAAYINSEFIVNRTLICATAADHQKDSAQRVLYDLTTAMGVLGHHQINSANRYDRAQKFAGQVDDIVLVDEFLGTGRSIIGRVESISLHFQQKNFPIPRFHVFVIAGMDFGLRSVAPYVQTIYPFLALKPGIRGFLSGIPMQNAYASLDMMENNLAPNLYGYALPRRGDGQCEALYGRNRGNCPNSVLPIFWWPKNVHGESRLTPFSRVH